MKRCPWDRRIKLSQADKQELAKFGDYLRRVGDGEKNAYAEVYGELVFEDKEPKS